MLAATGLLLNGTEEETQSLQSHRCTRAFATEDDPHLDQNAEPKGRSGSPFPAPTDHLMQLDKIQPS
jgi:hypothetical protein